MQFVFSEDRALPQMAWCAALHAGRRTASIRHGSAVHFEERLFVEGAWSGPFTPIGLREAAVCVGSGAVAADGTAVFVTPTDTLARLHVTRVGDRLFVSNSLAFLLAAAGLRVDPHYLFYEDDFSSITKGLEKAVKAIPAEGGHTIRLFHHCNVVVGADLSLVVEPKRLPPAFADFAGYHGFLRDSLAAIRATANHPGRRQGYAPIVSVSRGYDSPTCAVLSRSIGCTEAVTFYDPFAQPPDDDNGTEIAAALGMRVTAASREAYRECADESEFLAVGTGGDALFVATLEDALRGRMLLTGFHGDKVWDRANPKVTRQIVRGDPSGADLEEFRLRVGFIHVAIPFFGCLRHPEIDAISNAVEMAPWTLGTAYDRPICRRIVETAGIARDAFGQHKRVMSRAFFDKRDLGWYFGSRSLDEFNAFASARLAELPSARFRAVHAVAWAGQTASQWLEPLSYRLSRLPLAMTASIRRYAAPLDERRLLFHWAIEKIVARYAGSAATEP